MRSEPRSSASSTIARPGIAGPDQLYPHLEPAGLRLQSCDIESASRLVFQRVQSTLGKLLIVWDLEHVESLDGGVWIEDHGRGAPSRHRRCWCRKWERGPTCRRPRGSQPVASVCGPAPAHADRCRGGDGRAGSRSGRTRARRCRGFAPPDGGRPPRRMPLRYRPRREPPSARLRFLATEHSMAPGRAGHDRAGATGA